MANTEIFLRNIFGTTRPNIRPLVLALNITNDLLFEQHISMSDIKATKHIYPDVARLLHKKPETVYKSVIRLAHRCWDALVEQELSNTSALESPHPVCDYYIIFFCVDTCFALSCNKDAFNKRVQHNFCFYKSKIVND